jgi:type I restriction enzyme, S subunit
VKYKPYPKYKASNVEWLGDVPDGWGVVPFKREIERNDGGAWGGEPDTDAGTLTIVLRSTEQTADGRWKINDPAVRRLSDNELTGSLLEEGDLVVTKSSGSSLHIGKTTLVSAEVAKLRCCYSNFMQRIRVRRSSIPAFLWYVMNNDISRSQFDLLSNSTTGLANLNSTMIGELKLSIPPAEEQSAIATFLDRETAKIDTLIAKQEKLIDRLKEKRQTVISHAVTKGLDPTAPMKPSGVEWLGDIPINWMVSKLGFEAWVRARLGWKGLKAEEYVENGFAFLATPNIKGNDIDFENVNYINQNRYDESPEIKLNPGDVLLTKDGSTLGTVNVVRHLPRPATVNSSIAVITPGKALDGIFLYFLFQSSFMQNTIQMTKGGMGVPHLFQEDLNKFHMPLPPLAAQLSIAAYLDDATAKIDTLIAKARQAIALQKEHRTALISAAVTGKIDVRNEVQARKAA